jgi:hypothetical protein
MSVCIAAICCGKSVADRRIFAICDRKASSVEFSNEDAVVKGFGFLPKWLAMFAGNDISPCRPILTAVSQELAQQDSKPITAELVKQSFEKQYQSYLSNLATSRVLGRWKLNMEQFLETGRARFGDDSFDNLVSQIEQIKLQFQFLVCGFDDFGGAHLFTVKNPGYIEDRQTPGYWAIGTGDYAAMSTLGFFHQSVIKTLGETYYNVMAAKFMAEKASHEVGEKSFFWQLGKAGKQKCDGGIEAPIRSVWEQLGKPTIPEWFVEELEQKLHGKETTEEFLRKLAERGIKA